MLKMISKRLNSLPKYAFAAVGEKVEELKKEGIEPINFGVGDPTYATPEIVRNAVKEAVEKRKSSGYPSYIGSEDYRKAVADWVKKRFNVSLDIEKEICSNIGAKESIFNFPEAFVNPGDYVLIPNPGYPPYKTGTIFAEARPYFIPLLKENDFFPKLGEIPEDIVKKAKILWLNYPNSPTGKTATKEFYKEAIDFCHDNNIILASDEAYSEIYFKEKPMSVLELSKEGVVVINSLSKRSAMTCYRVGWLAGDENIISVFKKLKTNIDSGTPTFIQDAAVRAYSDETHVEKMRNEYKEKAEILCKAFEEIGLENCMPEATIYIWQKIPNEMASVDFAKKLLEKDIAIVTTPGEWISEDFGGLNPGKDYVRFAMVPSLEQCKTAGERIRKLRF